MIWQTCQRCGYVFQDQPSASSDTREEVVATVWVGQWEREYRLCNLCAAELQRAVDALTTQANACCAERTCCE